MCWDCRSVTPHQAQQGCFRNMDHEVTGEMSPCLFRLPSALWGLVVQGLDQNIPSLRIISRFPLIPGQTYHLPFSSEVPSILPHLSLPVHTRDLVTAVPLTKTFPPLLEPSNSDDARAQHRAPAPQQMQSLLLLCRKV